MEMNAEVKAMLVSIGSADIDEKLITTTTTPTAGPGAGMTSFFFRSGGHRVRLGVSKNSPLKVIKENNEIVILKDGTELVRGELEDALSHCPGQAYITISESCIYDCKFCPVPKLRGEAKSLKTILDIVEECYRTGKMEAISITSGIETSPEDEVEKAVKVVAELKKRYQVPIGVSVYPTRTSSHELKEAGAVEIKYNVETMDPEIFKRVCSGLSLEFIMDALNDAVSIFGRNRVFSNFIIGLGESDECVERGVTKLVRMGVIPILRPISQHPLREGEVFVDRPSPERLIRLAEMLREILDRYGLRADISQTMCLPCTGCDMTPHRDV
jgi:biotin synthase-related radical SAM superfamily protein